MKTIRKTKVLEIPKDNVREVWEKWDKIETGGQVSRYIFWMYIMELFPDEHLEKRKLEFPENNSVRLPDVWVHRDVKVPTLWDKLVLRVTGKPTRKWIEAKADDKAFKKTM